MLVIWRRRSAELAQLHEGARCYYRTLSDSLSLSSLAMSAIASSAAVLNGVGGVSGALSIATGVVGVLSTVLVSVNTFMAPAKLQQAHDDCQKKYMKMARDITVHMHLDSVGTDQMFINIHQCMRYMQNIFDDLEDQAPSIPKFIIRKQEDAAREAGRDACDFGPGEYPKSGRSCRGGGAISNSMYRFSDSEYSLDIARQDSIRRGPAVNAARFSPIVETNNSAGNSFNAPIALTKSRASQEAPREATYAIPEGKPTYVLPDAPSGADNFVDAPPSRSRDLSRI